MPELPEIETICNYLNCNIKGLLIKKVIIRQNSLRWKIPQQLSTILINQKISKIYRRAKYLIIDCYNKLDNYQGSLIIHLGMSGRLIVTSNNSIIQKHDHVDFILNNNTILRYNDPRRFGAILWTQKSPYEHYLLNKLGPEPFDTLLNAQYLLEKAKKQRTLSIKQFIMNNKIMVGVGNIYANEALFAAKINPTSLAKNLTIQHMEIILKSIRKILLQAIKQGGTTLKDFIIPNGQMGKFVNMLKVYGKNNLPCSSCNTEIIQLILGQRSTFYCPKCQIYC